jgi:hypothetical protein
MPVGGNVTGRITQAIGMGAGLGTMYMAYNSGNNKDDDKKEKEET